MMNELARELEYERQTEELFNPSPSYPARHEATNYRCKGCGSMAIPDKGCLPNSVAEGYRCRHVHCPGWYGLEKEDMEAIEGDLRIKD